MKISICKLEKRMDTILALAEVYQQSYNRLSERYKTAQEMAFYTKGYFIKKLWNMARDDRSIISVLQVDSRPCGFIRYSKVPSYYHGQVLESGYLDGFEYARYHKVHFDDEILLNDKTLIVNQLYLAPNLQHKGLGRLLFERTIEDLKGRGYKDLVIEYNIHNDNARKFYHKLGFRDFGRSKDMDHILSDGRRTIFCLSDVRIAHTTIDNALKHIREGEMMKRGSYERSY